MTNPVYAIIAVRTVQTSLLVLGLHWGLGGPLTGPHALGLVFTPLLCAYFVFVFIAPWSWGLPVLTRLPTRDSVVALTFDDGPSPETTPCILDTLKAHSVSATFFVLGEAVQKYPHLLRRIVAEGHAVGLHGYRHRTLTLAPWPAVLQEIRQTRDAIHDACPNAPPPVWFRPPHGFKNFALPWLAHRSRCRLVTWTLNPRDYRPQTSKRLVQTTFAGLRPGAIILLHDGPANALTAEALPNVLAGLAERGYRSVGLP